VLTAGTSGTDAITVGFAGLTYTGAPVADGAAYEIFSDGPADGFLPDPRATAALSFRRFVHSTEVDVLAGIPPTPSDTPLRVPLTASMSWATAHRMSQQVPGSSPALDAQVRAMRDSVRIARGTRMIKILSPRRVAGYLHGLLPFGFCHREFDIAHLRTPADLAILGTDHVVDPIAPVFALRWRAVGPADYAVPYAGAHDGLISMSPHLRAGAPVLGTGFTPTSRHIVPEFVTADFADLPLPAHAELIAFTADGTEVLLYRYQAEQRAWSRLAGRQWRDLLAAVDGLAPDQEYFPVPASPTRLYGSFGGATYEAVADPRANEFLVLAKVRALRHEVADPFRRTPTVRWRDERCTVIRESDGWLRLRLTRPSPSSVERLGAACVERGVYETWAPGTEAMTDDDLTVPYAL